MSVFKRIIRAFMPNPLYQHIRSFQEKKVKSLAIVWNRGLGDIALGLYGLVHEIKTSCPDIEITFLTRPDLAEGFLLLKDVHVLTIPSMKRGDQFDGEALLAKRGLTFDAVMTKIDPTYWLKHQLGKLTPRLVLEKAVPVQQHFQKPVIALHVNTETGHFYGYDKNLPVASWYKVIEHLLQAGYDIVLLGLKKDDLFSSYQVHDKRGELSLVELMQFLMHSCDVLVAPDSGILSLTFYLDHAFPLHIVSFWSDPIQGVLKHGVPSPNPLLKHDVVIEPSLQELDVERILDYIPTQHEVLL